MSTRALERYLYPKNNFAENRQDTDYTEDVI
jgi:hypothetical protein